MHHFQVSNEFGFNSVVNPYFFIVLYFSPFFLCKHLSGLCFFWEWFRVALKKLTHIKGRLSELCRERRCHFVLMGIKMARLSSCLWNFDLVTSKCLFMWCSVI